MLMYLTIIDSKEGQQKFEFIYNRYKKLMFYIANKILGDTRDSEDTVHDAFLKIIEIIDDIKDVESPQTRSLIVTITENKAIDLYRKRQRKTVLPFEEEYLGVPNCSDIESVEDNEVVTKAIASLSGKYREVLFLKYSHGYSIDEMALILSMSKYIPKQFFGFFCAIICAFSLAIPGYAVELPDPDTDISFYMENISDAQCVLSIRNGKAAARVSVNGNRGAERSKIILEIQKQRGSQWVTVESWSVEEDGRNASLSKSVEAEKGTTYRAKAEVTVWINGKSETKTITTTGKTA